MTEPISVYDTLGLNVPLLVKFQKLKFPEYKITENANSIFPSKKCFEQFEATCELFANIDRVSFSVNVAFMIRYD